MTKNMILLILASKILFGCGTVQTKTTETQIHNKTFINIDSTLVTGWYYVLDKKNGFKRQLDKDTSYFYLDPNPIITVKNISDFEIYTTKTGEVGLKMTLDEKGTLPWAEATEKYKTRHLAFIVDNRLLHVPFVNSKITFGITALNRDIYSRKDLEAIAKIIKEEKK